MDDRDDTTQGLQERFVKAFDALTEAVGQLETARSKKPPEHLPPDAHWSFKATPLDSDLQRILDEADKEGIAALAIRFCGTSLIALRTADFEPLWLWWTDAPQERWIGDWTVYPLDPKRNPIAVLTEMLALYEQWVVKKHRTTVAGWKLTGTGQ